MSTSRKFMLSAIVLALFAPTAASQAQEIVPRHPHEIVEYWARVIGFGLAGTSALLIGYVLLLRRKDLGVARPRSAVILGVSSASLSTILLFLGICVIPLPLSLLSTAVGMERSKRVEFCNSCHVMETFVDDMKDKSSKSLAAVHYANRYIQREQCYACHTNYGIFGTIAAKKSGLGHIWKDATGDYDLPIEIAAPYDWGICVGCHGESRKFRTKHLKMHVTEMVAGTGERNCLSCHDAPHPARETRSGK